MPQMAPRRKVFISYYKEDALAAKKFITKFKQVFIPKELGIRYAEDLVDSKDTDYVMGRIRTEVLGDSTITLVLIGPCTHSRRYIDWEIKASLRQGDTYTPNGLIGILLPGMKSAYLPPRFQKNWNKSGNCYAAYASYPTSDDDLRSRIEEAHLARNTRRHLIINPQDRFKYNAKCKVHDVTH